MIFEAARSTLLAMQGDEKLPSLKTLQAEQAADFLKSSSGSMMNVNEAQKRSKANRDDQV